jgi:hypothetical protein
MKCLTPSVKKKRINGVDHEFRHPCGKCDHCTRTKATQWKARILLEALEHQYISFVTFTLNEIHYKTLEKEDAQRLLKRLRKSAEKAGYRDIRYYLVKEYGSRTGREHFHAIIYGVPFTEQHVFEEAWSTYNRTRKKRDSLGFVHAREFTDARAGYIVKYTTKFLRTPNESASNRSPEFALMSRGRPKRNGRMAKKGLGLNGLFRITHAIKRSHEMDNKDCTPSQYWARYCNGLRFGRSRTSINPYLKKCVTDILYNEEYEQHERDARAAGLRGSELDLEMVRYERRYELSQALWRSKQIPKSKRDRIVEMGERKMADKTAKRRQRETKRKIKL